MVQSIAFALLVLVAVGLHRAAAALTKSGYQVPYLERVPTALRGRLGLDAASVAHADDLSPAHPVAPAAAQPATNDPVAKIVFFLKRKRWARRGLSLASFGLLAMAVGMLGYPVWTNWEAGRTQDRLEREFATAELRDAYRNGEIGEGDSLTRIIIPRIDLDVIVVEGTSGSALRAGAGHYPATALPCEDGNVAIAGHRTTYGRPFHNLDLLRVGDTVILETPVGRCSYEVTRAPFVVTPEDTSVLDDTPGDGTLTLTTCHPKGSAAQRLIVRAKMISAGSSQT